MFKNSQEKMRVCVTYICPKSCMHDNKSRCTYVRDVRQLLNPAFNLLSHGPDIDKIYLYAQNPYEAKYQLLISKREVQAYRIQMIQMLLLDIQMIWMIFTKILKNTIQMKNEKY